ncbi:two-component system, chemotaxis family, response regulator CheB [Cnuella takakiae]|uniref:protein-glutamate methylesterase n=1 Tax=Cnuella takakiae TaxID=1302690 RepID=A0A1M5BVT2_9BACT|nr:chemotaxis protein CheB [Cnuella takakiae]OLY93536.1 chemotaxis protein CheB [Cnuella takakiae]SHF46664.1 two-component system, chemotaxis family, response regulator CheB [Cnuella takakiae]
MAQTTVGIRTVLVVGGSAGSLDPVLQIVGALPADTDAAIVIVVHRKAGSDSILSNLLAAKTSLPVKEVEDKDPVLTGHIFLAPPDYHLLFENRNYFALDASEKINYSRPSIDVTFESAAAAFGSTVVGVLLSGANADGAEGLAAIRNAGGLTLVQDPATAEVYYMPQQAILLGAAGQVVHKDQLPARLAALLRRQP